MRIIIAIECKGDECKGDKPEKGRDATKLPIKNAFRKPGNASKGLQHGTKVDAMFPCVDFLLPDRVFRR
ncbi:MAG: hypothetical protein HUU07_16505 [Candidatus Brocadia sinica]|nr:hypothetical protein [Candidatus Brocadia sinica]